MAALHYSVTARLPDEETAERYCAWLEDGHVQAVLAGGAQRATVSRLRTAGAVDAVEVRYEFPDPAAFERYEAEHAPALRQEGRELFGSIAGVEFERRVALVRSCWGPEGED